MHKLVQWRKSGWKGEGLRKRVMCKMRLQREEMGLCEVQERWRKRRERIETLREEVE